MSELNQTMTSAETTPSTSTPSSSAESNSTTNNSTDTSTQASTSTQDSFLEGLEVDFKDDSNTTQDLNTTDSQQEDEKTQEEDNTTQEENTESLESKEDTQQQDDIQDFLKIKYNGQEQMLSKQKAIELAQKGQNYDKKLAEVQSLKQEIERLNASFNAPLMQSVMNIAKKNNMTADQLAQYFNNYEYQNELSSKVQELRSRYPQAQEELLRELASKDIEKEKYSVQAQQFNAQQQKQAQLQQQNNRELQEFTRLYPNVKEEEFTEDFLNDVRQGMNVTTAWEKHLSAEKDKQIKELKTEMEKLQKAQKERDFSNKVQAKSTGSLKGSNPKNVDNDSFLGGYDSF